MAKQITLTCLLIGFIISCRTSEINADNLRTVYSYGVLTLYQEKPTNDLDNHQDFCFTYPSKVFNISNNASPKNYSVVNESGLKVCESEGPSKIADSLFVMTTEPNCTLINYIEYITVNNSGNGLIMISPNLYYYDINQTYNLDMLAIITNDTYLKMQDLLANKSTRVRFTPIEDSGNFDGSMLVLWFLACSCVFLGAYFGPYRVLSINSSDQEMLESSNADDSNMQVQLSVTLVLILVTVISVTLLLLYFFYTYIVYVFIFIFCIASCRAVFDMLNHISRVFNLHHIMPKIRNIGIHQIVIAAISVGLPITWFILRDKYYIWILQDILGICFCINLIQLLRLPNLKICTVLLSLLFIYDIFFVFITPFITPDGKSIMVEVATGGGSSGEMLPLLLKIPHIQSGFGLMSVCSSGGFSLLGFGDIIVPGFLVCFAHSFDIVRGGKCKPYFLAAYTGYCCGLAIAFLVLLLTQTGQPALLYIVPSTLMPIYTVAIMKREVRDIWNGSMNVVSAVQ